MKSLKYIILSFFVAVIAMMITIKLVSASTGTLSEGTLYHYYGGYEAPQSTGGASCYGGGCKASIQNGASPSAYSWATAANNAYYWYAYCPSIGQTAANYGVLGESWITTMNQQNQFNQGTFVYLGYSDVMPNSGKRLYTSNGVPSGWTDYDNFVFWDDMQYTY